jgi:divalent metal cation (Fe/Co/Zn/Cd) transporter
LHDKTLAADARMNRADWFTGVTGMAGVAGIMIGWWWADALAATIISIEVVRDGFSQVKQSVADIVDERPTKAEEKELAGWEEKLKKRLATLDWVKDVDIRLREEGNLIGGEVFVVPATEEGLTRRHSEIRKVAQELDWRFYELSLVLVDHL